MLRSIFTKLHSGLIISAMAVHYNGNVRGGGIQCLISIEV